MSNIKLIYDKFHNDHGFMDSNWIDNDIDTILFIMAENLSKININKNRVLNIYTWGIKKYSGEKCDINFDLTHFQSKIDPSLDIHKLNGFSQEIIISIIKHPKFIEIMETLVNNIEQKNPKKIGIFCNHGKHRSVCFAELLKKYIYTKAKVKHLCNPRRSII